MQVDQGRIRDGPSHLSLSVRSRTIGAPSGSFWLRELRARSQTTGWRDAALRLSLLAAISLTLRGHFLLESGVSGLV